MKVTMMNLICMNDFDEYVYFMFFIILKIGNCLELGSRIFCEINKYIMSYIN